jgi:hypothetical protein
VGVQGGRGAAPQQAGLQVYDQGGAARAHAHDGVVPVPVDMLFDDRAERRTCKLVLAVLDMLFDDTTLTRRSAVRASSS